jgi:hypothetical protein
MGGYAPGPIACRGAFTGEFGLGDELPLDEAPYVIERDRINEGRLPGFNRKLLPLQADEATGRRTAGGYYLLDTPEHARHMFDWYQDPVHGFVLDGIPILKRAYFKEPRAHWWTVLGAQDFAPLESAQKLVRFERWHSDDAELAAKLERDWPALRAAGAERGLAALWLLFNSRQDENIGLISVMDRGAAVPADAPDFAGLRELAAMHSPGAAFEKSLGAVRRFDRSSWVFSIWFPWSDRRTARRTLWPNSPPFPGL